MVTSYKSWKEQGYVSEFLSLKCAGDVLNVCSPLGSKAEKEITEAMAIIRRLRRLVLNRPMKYHVLDLCSGNALVPIIAIHLLPILSSAAVDKRERNRQWHRAQRFTYHKMDICSPDVYSLVDKNTIITGVHPCQELASRTVEIYRNSQAAGLLLMPCCIGNIKIRLPQFILERLGRYLVWTWQLADKAGGSFSIDNKVLSPKNAIVSAWKRRPSIEVFKELCADLTSQKPL